MKNPERLSAEIDELSKNIVARQGITCKSKHVVLKQLELQQAILMRLLALDSDRSYLTYFCYE